MRILLTSLFLVAAAAVAGPGCTHVTPAAQTRARVQERNAVYNGLTPRQQDDILGGAIERGYTGDMVYMALGKPKRVVTSADGMKAMWVYEEFYVTRGPASFGFDPSHAGEGGSYATQIVAANTPFHYPNDPGYKGVKPQEFGGRISAYSQTLAVPDLQSKTVYVFFFRGRVAEIKLDGDASDQASPAPNATRSGTGGKVTGT